MTTLYLIRGVPGSGKSSLANEFYDKHLVSVVLEADQFFVNDGIYEFDPRFIHQAHLRCQDRAMFYLKHGDNVAVSNTSTTEKEVEVYRKIAEECGANFVSIIVENRHGGTNVHGVPEDKIQQMKNRFSVKL